MKYLLSVLLLSFLLVGCDKEYLSPGTPESNSNNTNNGTTVPTISIDKYFNNNVGIRDLYIDTNNNFWIATTQGLLEIKNNGSYVKYNTLNTILTDNNIYSITPDKSGNLWLVIRQEVYRFNTLSGNWTRFCKDNGLPVNFYDNKVFVSPSNRIYITAGNNIYEYENQTWEPVIANSQILQQLDIPTYGQIMAKEDSIFWIGTYNDGLLAYVNDSNYTFYNTVNSNISDNSVRYVGIDNSGYKWIQTDSGIEMFDGTNWYCFDKYFSVVIDENIVLANAVNNQYVSRYSNGNWTNIPNLSSYPYQFFVIDIDRDINNHVWLFVSSNEIVDYSAYGYIQ